MRRIVLGVERIAQVEPADFRADVLATADDVESGLGCDNHGTSSLLFLSLLSESLIQFSRRVKRARLIAFVGGSKMRPSGA